MKSRVIEVTKSELQVLACIREYESIKKTTKHHNRAIEKLKSKGIIYKDDLCILQITPQFSKKWFSNGNTILTLLTISETSNWKSSQRINKQLC